MTQKEQVIAALKKIGGKGTTDEILKAIDGIDQWQTKTPKQTVASILSKETSIKRYGNDWVYSAKVKPSHPNTTMVSTTTPPNKNAAVDRGLYFITIIYQKSTKIPGFLFKVGLSDGRVGNRLADYGASLPISPIEVLKFYTIPLDVDLDDAEKLVHKKLVECDSITRYYGTNNAQEWFQTDLQKYPDGITTLAQIIEDIVQKTIAELRAADKA